jgi:hypothetical protein
MITILLKTDGSGNGSYLELQGQKIWLACFGKMSYGFNSKREVVWFKYDD